MTSIVTTISTKTIAIRTAWFCDIFQHTKITKSPVFAARSAIQSGVISWFFQHHLKPPQICPYFIGGFVISWFCPLKGMLNA